MRLNKYKKLKLLIVMALGLCFLMGMHGTAKAIPPQTPPIPSRTLPESSDFSQGNNVWLTVAKSDGVNYLLDAETSVVRIYSSSNTVQLTITNGGHCIGGSNPDAGASEGSAQTRFEFRKMKGVATPYDFRTAPFVDDGKASADRYSDQLGCGATPVQLTDDPGSNADQQGYIQNGKYAFEIRVTWMTAGASGWNQYKLGVDLGRLSYYAGSGDQFALKASNSACSPYIYPGCTGQFYLGFAPNCDLAVGSTVDVPLKWFDADAGEPNQGGETPVKTAIIEYDASNTRSGYADIISTNPATATDAGAGQLYIKSGNGVHGQATIRIKAHHKYAWVWTGIHTANGIQFQLPTDGYNTLINFNQDCGSNPGPVTPDATCTATPSTPSPAINNGIKMRVKVTNTSGAGGPIFNSNYQVRQVPYPNPPAGYTSPSPGGGANNLSKDLPPGQTDSGIPLFTINARATPQTIRFYYALFDPTGTAVGGNPLCHADVTWRAGGGGGGSISADCSTTTVFGVSSPATWHPTPATYVGPQPPPATSPPRQAAAVKIGKVPVAIRITDPSTGASFTKIINGGIDNDTGSATFSTYDLWSAMWLHKAYTLDLFVEGVGGGDSLSYNNNGFWNPTNDANAGGFYYGIGPNPTDTTTVQDCMEVSCGAASTVDAEPGQTKQLSYGVHVTNLTQRTYSANDSGGYYFVPGSSAGITNLSGPSPSQDIVPGDPTNINVNFSGRIDYGDGSSTGLFWVGMYFQGSPLSLLQPNPCPGGPVTPATRPYFEVRGGDISTGGGFADAVNVCPTSAPGYISPGTGYRAGSGAYDYAGGIRAYGNVSGSRGSEAEFGVLALGLNIGSLGGPVGFFSGHGEMFANNGVNPPHTDSLGGFLSPSGSSQAHCVDDFFTKTRITGTTPTGVVTDNLSVTGLNGQYEKNGDLTIHASNINVGQRLTLYVTGNVLIDGDINYAKTWDPAVRTQVPYFTLIVKGNITLTGGVSQLDGLYIAQPTGNFTNGIFKTCDDFCPGQLIVNGAVIAQSVQLTHAHGTLGPLDADVNNITENPAEIFNYVPSMLIGLPQFNPLNNGTESLFNLPPVF